MILLMKKKENGTYFEFDKILRSGYKIKEDYDRTTQKFVNGNRRQFLSDYEDIQISIDLSPLDKNDIYNYLSELTNGEYKYYSLKYNQYKSVNMIVDEMPEISIDSAINNDLNINNFTVKLLKSSNINISL